MQKHEMLFLDAFCQYEARTAGLQEHKNIAIFSLNAKTKHISKILLTINLCT
jgi:hypothetical protein